MLSLPANWSSAYAGSAVQPTFWVQIDNGTNTFNALLGLSRDPTLSQYPSSVAEVKSISATMNVQTRECQVGEQQVTFMNDGWIKDVVVNNRIRGKKLTIKVGTPDLAAADFAPYFVGAISSITPQPDGSCDLMVGDMFALLRDAQVVGYWAAKHPAEVIKDILVKAGVPSSLYNATSLDPTQAQWASLSHLNIARAGIIGMYQDTTIRKPQSALKLVSEVAWLVNGQFVAQEDGTLTFVVFDAAGTIRDTLDDDAIEVDSVEFTNGDDNLLNRLTVNFENRGQSEYFQSYVQDYPARQTDVAFPGQSACIVADEHDTDWIEIIATFGSSITGTMTPTSPAAGATFTVVGGTFYGACGARWPGFPSGSQPASAKLSDSRLAWLKIDNEIIECDRLTVSSGVGSNSFSMTDPATLSTINVGPFPNYFTYRVKQRGALGTTAASHGTTTIYDITLAVLAARAHTERFVSGVPTIRLKVPLSKYALQLGDLVKVSSTKIRYYSYGVSALDTDTIWEIVSKEVSFTDDPGITLTLAWAAHASAVVGTPTAVPAKNLTSSLQAAAAKVASAAISTKLTGFKFVAS
jgi:hypothetical protein